MLLLPGCSLLPGREPAGDPPQRPALGSSRADGGVRSDGRDAFTLTVRGPDDVRDYLSRNLEMRRYAQVADLGAAEVSRLMVAAEANARELLGTLGYFTPTLTLELAETPDDTKAPRAVTVTAEPGERTIVGAVQIDFRGPIARDASPPVQAQRDAIRRDWPLRVGEPFTQNGWDGAKAAALRTLNARRFPTGLIAESRADIDADRHDARLGVSYESGPAYRFGPLVPRGGIERYGIDAPRRLARLPTGSDYDQQQLLDAQQRLASSGYYDSVFLTLDTESGDPQAAPVIAQLREAPLQKVVLGAGFTTDSGPRLSIDHIHNQLPPLGWRAVSKLSVDHETKLLRSELNSIPDDQGWRWFGSGELKREISGTDDVDSGRLRGGTAKSTDHIDRSYFLQYDYAKDRGETAPPPASALSVNWGWTGRYFDNATAPTRGHALALEVGLGATLTGERTPFTRVYARYLGILPLGRADGERERDARRSRLQLRAEAGAVAGREGAQIPSTLLFLTGGDTSVRGYSYRQIGTLDATGRTVAGRYLGVASVEWQRPVVWQDRLTDFESVAFVDAGAVADKPGELKAKVGLGVGARWKSPVGPLQLDVAYGVDVKKLRLHVRFGFNF